MSRFADLPHNIATGIVISALMSHHATDGSKPLHILVNSDAEGAITPRILFNTAVTGTRQFVCNIVPVEQDFDSIVEQLASMGFSLIIGKAHAGQSAEKYVALVYGTDLSEALGYGRWESDVSPTHAAKQALDAIKDLEYEKALQRAMDQRPDAFGDGKAVMDGTEESPPA